MVCMAQVTRCGENGVICWPKSFGKALSEGLNGFLLMTLCMALHGLRGLAPLPR